MEPFPRYTSAEIALDRALHVFAILLALVGTTWLFLTEIPTGKTSEAFALAIYSIGLIGMLLASAAYNCWSSPHRKELFRRIDHAMIFITMAATSTPFALSAFPGLIGPLLFVLIWIVATIGVILKLAFLRRSDRILLALYVAMGWVMLGTVAIYGDNLSDVALFLLLGGGMSYSYGAVVHARGRYPFHNVVWHGLVVLGAGAHWAAVVHQVKTWPRP